MLREVLPRFTPVLNPLVGLNSSFKTLPLGYVFVCGNESQKTWTRVRGDAETQFLSMGRLHTAQSDIEKGIDLGPDSMSSATDRPH